MKLTISLKSNAHSKRKPVTCLSSVHDSWLYVEVMYSLKIEETKNWYNQNMCYVPYWYSAYKMLRKVKGFSLDFFLHFFTICELGNQNLEQINKLIQLLFGQQIHASIRYVQCRVVTSAQKTNILSNFNWSLNIVFQVESVA